MNRERKVEILAPAGSYESFRAAIIAGADAVYAGGPRFGARAYAKNFSKEQLLEAIDEAHLYGRKFYLTVNTLLKEQEMAELYDYLLPFYQGGLDAVIVQDLGVFSFVCQVFPDMEVHVSTQMTVTGSEGAAYLKERGAARVVPARELSLEEVRKMKKDTGMEIECFVHGALCYCYSGQCLLSSLIGGRSGNRGQCAQPCRLPYSANGEKGYLLSPKDICTLDLIPELIEAGIDSFKLEGRMKRPEYVAGVTSIYRKYADLYFEKGKAGYYVEEKDREKLMDLYNRGGFHTGYYKQHNGKEMISKERPNHAGVAAVRVTRQKGREVTGKALTEIQKGDVLSFPAGTKEDYTFGESYPKESGKVKVIVPKQVQLKTGTILYRTKNRMLSEELENISKFGKIQEKIYGYFTLSVGKPAKLVVCRDTISAEVESEMKVETAGKRPLEEEQIRRQLNKTGESAFLFQTLDVEMDQNAFLPMQQINEMRRGALAKLEEHICSRYHRSEPDPAKGEEEKETDCTESEIVYKDTMTKTIKNKAKLTVLAETIEQLTAIKCFTEKYNHEVSRIYVDSTMDGDLFKNQKALSLCERLRRNGIEIYLAMPHIFRDKTDALFTAQYTEQIQDLFDGILVRNLESIRFLERIGFDGGIILDHNLYIFNRKSRQFWKKNGIEQFTAPLELNRLELEDVGMEAGEMVLYGNLAVMISAQCIEKTTRGCRKKEGTTVLTDRFQNHFSVRNHCRECYNVIYNSAPLYLLDQKDEVMRLMPDRVRLQFSTEDKKDTEQILNAYREGFLLEKDTQFAPETYTRGHFKRGVI